MVAANGRANDATWIVSRFPYMKAIGYLYLEIVLKEFWNNKDLASLKQDICAEADTPSGRLELFKSQLKRKDYKTWYDKAMANPNFHRFVEHQLDENLMKMLNVLGLDDD